MDQWLMPEYFPWAWWWRRTCYGLDRMLGMLKAACLWIAAGLVLTVWLLALRPAFTG